MAEFEELRVTVRVTDEASGQLGALKRSFDELGSVEFNRKMEGVNKTFAETEKQFKEMFKQFATGGGGLEGLVAFARGFGPIGLAIAATYETIKGTTQHGGDGASGRRKHGAISTHDGSFPAFGSAVAARRGAMGTLQ
jgi:hypothetical protein